MAFRAGFRKLSTTARSSLTIGLIPADGIGYEVIPVRFWLCTCVGCSRIKLQAAKEAILALGSTIPKPVFINLNAGWDFFARTGVALPDETIE